MRNLPVGCDCNAFLNEISFHILGSVECPYVHTHTHTKHFRNIYAYSIMFKYYNGIQPSSWTHTPLSKLSKHQRELNWSSRHGGGPALRGSSLLQNQLGAIIWYPNWRKFPLSLLHPRPVSNTKILQHNSTQISLLYRNLSHSSPLPPKWIYNPHSKGLSLTSTILEF